MINNLRSKPIEGHISDSAGNVLRNATVVIKQVTPNGTYVVSTSQSDDEGRFISTPLANGVYDIYESGSKISSIIHNPDPNKIQCFKAHKDNYDLTTVGDFNNLASSYNLNSFKAFIQIESIITDIYQYGNIFPIYDKNIKDDPGSSQFNELFWLANFFEFNSHSRISTTRFDAEYFSPLTNISNLYKRLRWVGVPAIKFYEDSRLIIPLDYYSLIANHPKYISPDDPSNVTIENGDGYVILQESSEGELVTLSNYVFTGDILQIKFDSGTWFGIIDSISQGTDKKTIKLEMWKSSRYLSDSILTKSSVSKITAFDGMFSNIMDINEEANERFSVVENIWAQNGQSELYHYPSE